MAKKEKNKRVEKNASDYYKLKTGSVDKLVNPSEAPVVPESEIKKYKSGSGKFKIPDWLKVVFLKFWFGGAVCFFFFWGLAQYIQNEFDLMVVIAIGLGLVTDLLLNHMLHFIAPEEGYYNKWMMFPSKKFWTIFLNCIYAGFILFFIMNTYDIINRIINFSMGNEEAEIYLGVEPLLFGVFYMGFDLLFIGIRNTIVKIVRDANKKASGLK
ncbi:MAG: hypothetical protein J1F03_05555 [Oscillospiraceae bacterium]|nr:hypothetical protein [Oscillospiraceae bacterium]